MLKLKDSKILSAAELISTLRFFSLRKTVQFLLILIFFVIPCSASEPEKNTEKESEKNVRRTDAFHAALSGSLNITADWIDSFFGEERVEIEEDNSSLRLKLSGYDETSRDVDFKVKARLHLVLPNLEEKYHVFASSILEEDETRNDYFDPDNEDDDTNRNFYLSLRYFIKAAEKRNLSFRAGVKFHKFTPAGFAGPRYRYSKPLGTWDFRLTEDLNYFTDNGWESKTSVDFEKSISRSLFYRSHISGLWQEYIRGYVYWLDNDIYHTFDDHRAINYRVVGAFNTYHYNRLSYVLAGVRYRQSFYRKWLFFEIAPQVIFRREEDYEASPGITLSIEAFFGNDFIEPAIFE